MNPTATTIRPGKLRREDSLPGDLYLVDVRTPAEFASVHVPGSVNIPLDELSGRLDGIQSRAATGPVTIVCQTGRRAASAAASLAAHGIVCDTLTGGLAGWLEAGLPVDRGAPTMSLERQVRIAAGALTVLGVVLGFAVSPGFFGLSAFVGAGLVFAGLTDTCGMALVLAKMPWNRRPASCARG